MVRALVQGSTVLANGDLGTITDGALIVEDGIITDVGPRQRVEAAGPFDTELGGPDRIIVPGFVNGHYHTECWTAPGLIGGRIFELDNLYMGSGLIDTTEEIIELLATYGLIHAAKGGQTTLIDTFYGRPWLPLLGAEAVLRAYRSVGIRVALGITMRDRNTYTHEDDEVFLARLPPEIVEEVRNSPLGYAWPIDDQFRVFDELYEKWDGRNGRSRIILAPDWTPACSDELYRRCRRVADEYGTTISTHALETRSELMWTVENVGPSGMRRLADLGVLGEDVTLSHFVWATDEDIAIVAATGAVPVHCPGSNLRSSAGICRVRDILDAGARISIGTDGISSGDREDFIEEVRLAGYLQREPNDVADHRIPSEVLLRSATESGAVPAGFGGVVGTLAPGYQADLISVRKDRIGFPPARYATTSELDLLVERADATDIDFVMVGGITVVEDGEVLLVDEHRLTDRINELADDLYKPTPEAQRRRELADLMNPHIEELCRRWYGIPVTRPASVMNTRSAPGR